MLQSMPKKMDTNEEENVRQLGAILGDYAAWKKAPLQSYGREASKRPKNLHCAAT
jgi:hypothetical protein